MDRRRLLLLGMLAALAVACSKKLTAAEDCARSKAGFLQGLRSSMTARVDAMAPDEQARAREFFDRKAAFAEAHYDAYCRSVTEAEWRCLHDVIEHGASPTGPCGPAANRLMKEVVDEGDPAY